MKYNIFQGSENLQKVVCEVLGYDIPQQHSWFTRDMYFETYFYLSNRFGSPKILDPEYKKIMIWSFEVKNYTIRIELNSSWVTFIVFGDYKIQSCFNNPYWIKLRRENLKKEHLLIKNLEDASKRSEYENNQLQKLLNEFQEEKNIPDNIKPDEFNEKYGNEFWFDRVNEFNNNVLAVNHDDYKKYGEYSNSKTRHALKTLRGFIKNMLTPIYIRDCPFNIKGRITDEDSDFYNRYKNNIEIIFKK